MQEWEDYAIGIIPVDYNEITRIGDILVRFGYLEYNSLAPEVKPPSSLNPYRARINLLNQIERNKKSHNPEEDIENHYFFKDRTRVDVVGIFFNIIFYGRKEEIAEDDKDLLEKYNPEMNVALIHEYFLWYFLWGIRNPSEDDIAYVCLLTSKIIDIYYDKLCHLYEDEIKDGSVTLKTKKNDNIFDKINEWHKSIMGLDKINQWDKTISYNNIGDINIELDGKKEFLSNIRNMGDYLLHGENIPFMNSMGKCNLLNGCIDALYDIIFRLETYAHLKGSSLGGFKLNDTLVSIIAFPRFVCSDEKTIYNNKMNRFDIFSDKVFADRDHEKFGSPWVNKYIQCFYGISLLENQFRMQHHNSTDGRFIEIFKQWLKNQGFDFSGLDRELLKHWDCFKIMQKIRNAKGSHATSTIRMFSIEEIKKLDNAKECIIYFHNIMNDKA